MQKTKSLNLANNNFHCDLGVSLNGATLETMF